MLIRTLMLAALTLGAAGSLAPAAVPAPLLCRVVIYTDYNAGVGYYAVPQLAPECPENAIGRLRKSSTINTRARGAKFQPIHPVTGAWTVTFFGDDVPNSEQFVYWFTSWEWQWSDGKRWIPAEVM